MRRPRHPSDKGKAAHKAPKDIRYLPIKIYYNQTSYVNIGRGRYTAPRSPGAYLLSLIFCDFLYMLIRIKRAQCYHVTVFLDIIKPSDQSRQHVRQINPGIFFPRTRSDYLDRFCRLIFFHY